MKLYLNVSLNTFIIPTEVPESLGRPPYFHLCYDDRNKIIFIVPDKQFTQDSFDVPKIFYTTVWKGIRIFGRDFGRKICKDMKWKYAVDHMKVNPYLALDENSEIVLVIPLQEAVLSAEKIVDQDYFLPLCQYEELEEEDEDKENEEDEE